MIYNHIYEPRALLEYEEAVLWYRERSKQASENFELAINEKLHEICMNPTLYRNTKKYFREAFLKKYPFSIIYFIDEIFDTIVVTSIFHNSRNPKRKYTA